MTLNLKGRCFSLACIAFLGVKPFMGKSMEEEIPGKITSKALCVILMAEEV